MSTRWYPIYQKCNPQLRVFLPNFWMKVIRPEHQQPPNVVSFACSMEMTMHDVKNYLEQIYKVPVVTVRTRIAPGKTKRDLVAGFVKKEDDTKIAYVTLPREVEFKYPAICESQDVAKKLEDEKALDGAKETYKMFLNRNKNAPKTWPGWFTG